MCLCAPTSLSISPPWHGAVMNFAILCLLLCSPANVPMKVPGSLCLCTPPVAKGQLAASQGRWSHEDPWVSQSSPRLAAVKEPFVELLCSPPRGSQPSGSPRSWHGRMSSSLVSQPHERTLIKDLYPSASPCRRPSVLRASRTTLCHNLRAVPWRDLCPRPTLC